MDSVSHLSSNNSYWSFVSHLDFWISLILAIVSVYYSYRSFKEASAAKEAAINAATTVKIQTITIELSEIIQHIDKLDPKIDFTNARDLLNENNRRVRRLIAPFKTSPEYLETINRLAKALDDAKMALESVRPIGNSDDIVNLSVYHAVESHFSIISETLAELMGLFEKRTIKI